MVKRSPFCFPLALGVALLACKSKDPAPAAPDAAQAPTASASAHAPAAAGLDDLLHFTDARIGVSSKVDNPRDFAEHVADGRLDTAWNGKTGDLVGGWIGFRVPKETRVRVIELVVGYAAKSKKGEDLFTMNHRIAKVRVTRDGAKVLEHAFDPDVRDYQRIVLDAPGGDFKLEVLETKAGTKKEWRELVVSELRVLGVAGAAKRATTGIPRVHVGGFDAPPPAVVAATPPSRATVRPSAASVDALCKAFLDGPTRAFHDLDGGAGDHPWTPPEPSCSATTLKRLGDVVVSNLALVDLAHEWREVALSRGNKAWRVGPAIAQESNFDPHCGGYVTGKILDARREGDDVVVEIYTGTVTNPWPQFDENGTLGEGTPGSVWMEIDELRCAMGDAGADPTCTTKSVARRTGPYGEDVEAPPPRPWK